MFLTPTNSGSVIAGVGVGVFSWSAFLKADKIPFVNKLVNTKRKESTLSWMNKNKGISLLGLEACNFGLHGVTNPNSVVFALGNTVLNSLMIFVWLPFRQGTKDKDVLRKV